MSVIEGIVIPCTWESDYLYQIAIACPREVDFIVDTNVLGDSLKNFMQKKVRAEGDIKWMGNLLAIEIDNYEILE